ncbi:hypothetical protein Ssi02_03710 [Sinosporangium siamense]|uniref:Uncharacterized protein n=1 Tax=Sinosporangium siamense TaxID=1367973 RepID=A0A919RC98_9ACTN|nr:hypothetical protein Ssi02_03710 [Sinosporangium siamense]
MPRRHAAGASAAEERATGELEIHSGHVIVVWAAVGAHENDIGSFAAPQEGAASLQALTRLNPPIQLNLGHILGVGTVLSAKPGTYRVTCGWPNGARGRRMPGEERCGSTLPAADDGWSCFWVRFTLADSART